MLPEWLLMDGLDDVHGHSKVMERQLLDRAFLHFELTQILSTLDFCSPSHFFHPTQLVLQVLKQLQSSSDHNQRKD